MCRLLLLASDHLLASGHGPAALVALVGPICVLGQLVRDPEHHGQRQRCVGGV